MNAFASPENTAIEGTEGTVGFGWDLFQREFYEFDSSGVTIMAIVAHEFGHVLQSKRGYPGRIRVGHPLESEINADFLSGYFMGTRKRRNPAIRFAPTGLLVERIAGYGPERTHGTPTERLDAAEAGFRIGYVENKGLDEAVQAGLEYIG